MRKQLVVVDSIVGHRFGSTFELNVKEKRMSLVTDLPNSLLNCIDNNNGSNNQRDNRFIRDDNSSQKLTREEIERIKKENSATDVIKSLVENSKTFEEKSVFSQEKYLNKKQQKYMNFYTILKPSIKLLVEMYYSQSPNKNKYTDSLFALRKDTDLCFSLATFESTVCRRCSPWPT